MRKNFRKSLSLLMALCMMVLSMLPTTAYADLNDTEFHIMDWEGLKDLVREANHVDQSEKLTIHSISVNGTDGTATGGAPKYTNQGDVGARGTNGLLTGYDNVWTVLNTERIKQDSITSITVYAKIKTGPLGYFGEELPPVTVYLDEDDIVLPLPGRLITEIYLTNASLEPIPPEEEGEGAVSIELVVDGTPVTLTDADELASYLSSTSPELTVGENGITAAFTYEGEDAWTDLTIVPAEEYVIQGVACDAEGASAEPQGGCQLTGVPDGSTLTLYLRTPYSVAYHVPQGITAPEDSSDYITAEDITEGLWVNPALNTEITLADLDGLDGWYSSSECEGDPYNGPVTVTEDLADGNNIIHFYAKPAVPSAEEIAKALGDGAVVVDCVNADAEHEDGHYGLLGNYTPDTAVINTGGTYTFGITVEPSDYAEQYSAELGLPHYLQGDQPAQRIQLVWGDGRWKMQPNPITVTVECDESGSILNDTEFHIVGLDKIKETVAEKRGLTNTNGVEIYTIYVHGTRNVLGSDGTATGGVVGDYGAATADEGRPGRNGMLIDGTDAWKVLNTFLTVNDATVSGITIYAKVNGQEVEVFVPRSELTITHLTGADSHITQIILEPELPSAPPTDVPDEEELADILGDVIKIHCTNDAAGHEDAVYSLISGSYTPDSNFTQDGDKYTFNVTIAPDYYVEQYSAETRATHTLVDGQANTAITLVWNGHEWEVQAPTLPVTYNVVCEGDGSLLNDTEFHIVGLDKIKETVAEKRGLTNTNGIEIYTIYVHGTRNVLGGDGKATGGVIGKYFLVPADEGRPGLNGILANGKYDAWKVLNTVDVISDDTVSGITIYAKVNGQEVEVFVPRSELTITHLTGADSHITQIILEPELPTAPLDPTANDLGAVVNLHCIKNTEHPDHTDLLCNVQNNTEGQNDSFEISKKELANGVWTCEVTVKPVQAYLNQYNTTYGPHTYADGQSAGKLTMTWDDTANEWTTTGTVTFAVACEPATPSDTYTLTYDANALGGTVSGMPTPNPATGLQNGSHPLSATKPTHSDVNGTDVVFIGWTAAPTTKIFSKNDTAPVTVTAVTINGADETVYAAWGYDVNGNGTPDVEETKYTLTYHANYRGNDDTIEYVYVAGEEVVVKGRLFSRSGYFFDKWNTRSNGRGTSYDRGDVFTMPAHDEDLYAQWTPRGSGDDDDDSYAVYYHPGYGRDARKLDAFYEVGETVEVLDNEWFQRDDYVFIGWSKTLDDDSPDYLPGDTFKMPSGTVDLYAQWKKVGIGPGDTGVADWLNTDDHIAYLAGYPGNLFGPDNSMTRAEVCQMFYTLLENKNVTITKTFNDVPADAWYTTAVNTLATLGMVSGYPDGSFRPNDPITRAEFCTIALAFAYEPEDATCSFTDVFVSDWFYPYVAQASTYGWIGGYPDGSFGPREHITRTEVTTIVNRMLGREADRNFVDRNEDELKQFIDLSDNYWGYYQIMEAVNSHEYERSNGVEDWIDLLQ